MTTRTRWQASWRRRVFVIGTIALVAGSAAAVAIHSRDHGSGYPLSDSVDMGSSRRLWSLTPEVLDRALSQDLDRMLHSVEALDRALAHAETEASLLSIRDVEGLTADQRALARSVWASFVEPLVAIEELKRRYRGWYGVDYLKHPQLHAKAFGVSFLGLCAEVVAGQRLLALVAGNERIQALFDEAHPESGLPAGTFRQLRDNLGRFRNLSLLPIASDWYDTWIQRHLTAADRAPDLAQLIDTRRRRAREALETAAIPTGKNKLELLKSEVFADLLPVQKEVAEWFGDTRVAPQERRLISNAQLADMLAELKPGDILVERRNWYLSNVGLPGFWPHAALYLGTPDEIDAFVADDPEVTAKYGKFVEYLQTKHPKHFSELASVDAQGHPHRVVEAISEGVVATSLEHSCGADYVAALRPRLPKLLVARAIDRALESMGRPYDFNFDFATDASLVCSELVVKVYQPDESGSPGLTIPFITVAGKRAAPPTEIVRVFANDRDEGPLAFVYFLDGRERERRAVVASAEDLAASISRPKWDVLQP